MADDATAVARLDTDVAVVGGGGAGLMAAVAAAQQRVAVAVLEADWRMGGTTALAIGSVTGAGSALQRAAGIADSAADHYADLLAIAAAAPPGTIDTALTRWLCEQGGATIDLLAELGVVFTGPHPEPPHRRYRMHNARPSGVAYIWALERAAGWLGVTLLGGCRVERLLWDADGVVAGVSTGVLAVRARRAVVLAAGDAAADAAWRARHLGPWRDLPPLNPLARGDGLRLGRAAGGAAIGDAPQTGVPSLRFVQPPHLEPAHGLFAAGAVAVDRAGRRLGSEGDRAALCRAVAQAPERQCYVLFDGRVAAALATAAEDVPPARDGWYRTGKAYVATIGERAYAYLDDCRGQPWFAEGATLDDLARVTGLPAEALAGLGAGPDAPLRQPPFYALGPVGVWVAFTDGGLRVDRAMRVLRADGTPLPRLFAAGATGQDAVFLGGHGHHLLWAFTSGRVAGANAAALPPRA